MDIGRWWGIGAIVVLLAGCTGHRGGDIPYNPAGFVAPDAAPLPTLTTDYRMGSGDVVSVRVFRVDSMSGDQTIDSAGRINLPLLGLVPAAGRTTSELQADLTQRLGTKYLNDPQVAVSLKSAVQKTITVDGSVMQPGLYPVQPGSTLITAIAMARGTAEGANPRRIVVFRRVNGQRMAAAFDLSTIRKGEEPDPAIYAEDVIVVDGSATSQAMKSVLQSLPFVSLFRPF